jgi:glycosyltransferase involved in cell wall biosynthesis
VNTRLRVVQVVCSAEFAGVERYVTNLSNDLAEAGCDVTVLGGDPLRMAQELSGKQNGWRPSRSVREAAVRLARLGHVDIVHTHMTEAEVAAAAVRIFTTGRFVSTRHFAARRGSGWAGRLAGVPLRRLVDVQLAVSHYVAAHIDGPSVVLHPGVPRDDSGHRRERTPVVLMAQRLAAEKHIDVALRAWERSELAHAGWELHLAGGGAEEGPLRSLAKDLGVADSCHFLGPRDDLAERYRRASLFFAPRPDEAFGLAVLEAMAAGLPVVAAAGGGHLETVGVCPDAALFEPGDVDGAAFQLRSLGAHEGRRQIYGQKLQAIQREHFDSSAQAEQMVAIYRALVDPHPTKR